MITYLYYRLCVYFKNEHTDLNWQRGRALIVTSGLLVANAFSIVLLINSIFFKGKDLLNSILSGNHLIDKFIIIPIFISPFFILVYYAGRKRLETYIEFYENESQNTKRKKSRFVLIYIIITFFLLQLAIFSPLFIT